MVEQARLIASGSSAADGTGTFRILMNIHRFYHGNGIGNLGQICPEGMLTMLYRLHVFLLAAQCLSYRIGFIAIFIQQLADLLSSGITDTRTIRFTAVSPLFRMPDTLRGQSKPW